MKAVIANRLVASIKPSKEPYEVRDSRLKGFILRVQPTGSMSYIAQYGRGKRVTIGKADKLTPAQARDRAKKILADVTLGADPMADRRAARAYDLKTYLRIEYEPWTLAHHSRPDAAKRIRNCFPDLLGRKLADINPWLIEKHRSARVKEGIEPTTINRDIATLRSALSKAVEWGILENHPLNKVKPLRVDPSARIRYLSEDEERRLRTAMDNRQEKMRRRRQQANAWREERGYQELTIWGTFTDYLKPIVLLCLNTGLRRGELFNLAWTDVDLDRKVLTVLGKGAKYRKTRHIPLNQEAQTILRDWRSQGDGKGLVLSNASGGRLTDIKTAWRNLVKAADIDDFRFHDLRHTFASNLVMAGVDLNTVRELLGHSDIKMTLRYAHLAPEHKAAAVELLVAAL